MLSHWSFHSSNFWLNQHHFQSILYELVSTFIWERYILKIYSSLSLWYWISRRTHTPYKISTICNSVIIPKRYTFALSGSKQSTFKRKKLRWSSPGFVLASLSADLASMSWTTINKLMFLVLIYKFTPNLFNTNHFCFQIQHNLTNRLEPFFSST